MSGKPIMLPARHVINIRRLLGIVVLVYIVLWRRKAGAVFWLITCCRWSSAC
jgi:NAD/NADP transhydrogenase beta subunit